MEVQRLLSSEAIINKSTLVTLSSSINSGFEKVTNDMETGHRIVRMGLDNLSARFDLAMANSTAGTSPILSDDGVGLFLSSWCMTNSESVPHPSARSSDTRTLTSHATQCFYLSGQVFERSRTR